MFNISDYKDGDGNLIHFAWPGGYPMFYLTHDNDVLCPSCANNEQDAISAADANWEDPQMYCEECNNRIESAYAEDEVEV